jgi:predicted dehydrogenase
MTSIQPKLPDRLEFHGEHGTIQLEEYHISRWEVPGAEDWPARVATEEQTAPAGHYVQLADMVGVVRDGRPPAVSGDEGRRSLEVVLAIYASARQGCEVRLPLEELAA